MCTFQLQEEYKCVYLEDPFELKRKYIFSLKKNRTKSYQDICRLQYVCMFFVKYI